MKHKNRILIILIGFIIGAISYWWTNDEGLGQSALLGFSIWYTMGIGAFLSSLIITLITNKKPWKISLLIMAGFQLAIICLIIYDIALDLEGHNIFPAELFLIMMFTTPAFVGAYISHLIKYIIKNRTNNTNLMSKRD